MKMEFIYQSGYDEEEDYADEAYQLANQFIRVLSHMTLNEVVLHKEKVIGASYTAANEDEFDFDVVVHPDYRRKGIAKTLIDHCVTEYEWTKEAFPDSVMTADVVNPVLVDYLTSIGFQFERKFGDHTLMRKK